jgi:hypothetical protein
LNVADPTDLDQPIRDIHTELTEVWRRVREWHDSPQWTDDEHDRRRYEVTAAAVDAAHKSGTDPVALTKAVQPIVDT